MVVDLRKIEIRKIRLYNIDLVTRDRVKRGRTCRSAQIGAGASFPAVRFVLSQPTSERALGKGLHRLSHVASSYARAVTAKSTVDMKLSM